jgi:hypothetical protein
VATRSTGRGIGRIVDAVVVAAWQREDVGDSSLTVVPARARVAVADGHNAAFNFVPTRV